MDIIKDRYRILQGDCLQRLKDLPNQSVQTCVTSPPYFGLRDYGADGQIGLEPTPDEFVAALVAVFREVRRVLRDDGTVWLNLGDSYARNPAKGQHKPGDTGKQAYIYDRGNGRASATFLGDGLKEKDLIGIPWRVAFALQADGWYLRQDIIWHKPNPMPESVRDRCTKAHEYIFLLSKGPRYFFDHEAIKEPAVGDPAAPRNRWDTKLYTVPGQKPQKREGRKQAAPSSKRNRRSVWTVPTRPYKGAHFATFPPGLIEPCILAGSRPSDLVLDPFNGSGTTGTVAIQHGRQYVGLELNPDYIQLAVERIEAATAPAKPKKPKQSPANDLQLDLVELARWAAE